jgi:hypothetical protein
MSCVFRANTDGSVSEPLEWQTLKFAVMLSNPYAGHRGDKVFGKFPRDLVFLKQQFMDT